MNKIYQSHKPLTNLFNLKFVKRSKRKPTLIQEKEGTNVEGIFRLSGSQEDILKVVALYENGKAVNFRKLISDPHAAAGILKLWLRKLPEGLLTQELHEAFIVAIGIIDRDIRMASLKAVLLRLPQVNGQILTNLMRLLKKISDNSAVTLMSIQNLAIIFAPTVCRAKDESMGVQMREAGSSSKLITTFITEYETLFLKNTLPLSPTKNVVDSSDSRQVDFFHRSLQMGTLKMARRFVDEEHNSGVIDADDPSVAFEDPITDDEQQIMQEIMSRWNVKRTDNDVPPQNTNNNKNNINAINNNTWQSAHNRNAFSSSGPASSTSPRDVKFAEPLIDTDKSNDDSENNDNYSKKEGTSRNTHVRELIDAIKNASTPTDKDMTKNTPALPELSSISVESIRANFGSSAPKGPRRKLENSKSFNPRLPLTEAIGARRTQVQNAERKTECNRGEMNKATSDDGLNNSLLKNKSNMTMTTTATTPLRPRTNRLAVGDFNVSSPMLRSVSFPNANKLKKEREKEREKGTTKTKFKQNVTSPEKRRGRREGVVIGSLSPQNLVELLLEGNNGAVESYLDTLTVSDRRKMVEAISKTLPSFEDEFC
eukprot:TRINITY_DN17365_c0_g1_i2.p1 TRINITY_DN17365_c0_g1~~TRINITY_DN17365_c0_g1_i2.p1  ORF type:complete len:597 (+),score=118.91 TRINITY_DN17365_c0_g1_i2:60-1850(+)